MNREDAERRERISGNAGGILSTAATERLVDETRAAFEGTDVFRAIAEMTGENPNRFGNLFEAIEAMKFNKAAASAGSALHADVTAHPTSDKVAKDIHNPADIVTHGDGKRIGHQLGTNQTEYWPDAKLARKMKDPKYSGLRRVVPEDRFERVLKNTEATKEPLAGVGEHQRTTEEAALYKDSEANLRPGVEHGDIRSGGTSSQEITRAGENPEAYARAAELRQAMKDVSISAGAGAAVGGALSGAVATVHHLTRVRAGEMTKKEAGEAILKDAGKGALRGGVVGGAGAAIRIGAQKLGIAQLSKAAPATTLAALTVDVGVTVWGLARGELTLKEASGRLAESGAATCSSLFISAGVASVMTAPALVTGGVAFAGYLIGSACYQACRTVLKEARLAEEECARIEALKDEALVLLSEMEAEIDSTFERFISSRRVAFKECIGRVMETLDEEMFEDNLVSLVGLAELTGTSLVLADFRTFDGFMLDETKVLEI